MGTNIAVEGMTLVIDDPTVSGVITITGSASLKVKASGSVYKNGLGITVSGITAPSAGATIPDPAPKNASLNSSATKTKADSTFVLLEGDETDTIHATPQIPGSPPINYPVTFKVKIETAGQIKVKAV